MRFSLTFICLTGLIISGCGSDYEANPIVIPERGDGFIIVDQIPDITPVGPVTGNPVGTLNQQQLQLLRNNAWRSPCQNRQISELLFSPTDRTTNTYLYADNNCTTLADNSPQVVTEPYRSFNSLTDGSGLPMTELQFDQFSDTGTLLNRSAFSVQNNRLYFGSPNVNPSLYPTALNYDLPYYPVSL